jgi:hypothetical protein
MRNMKDVGVARREKIVEGILGFAASENGPPLNVNRKP